MDQRTQDLESFLRKVAEAVGCVPCYSDPLHGNDHIFERMAAIKRQEARLTPEDTKLLDKLEGTKEMIDEQCFLWSVNSASGDTTARELLRKLP